MPKILPINTKLFLTILLTFSNCSFAATTIQDEKFNQQVDTAIKLSLEHLESSVKLIKNPALFPTYGNKELTWELKGRHKWTAGFYPGSLWEAYSLSGDPRFQDWAIQWTETLADQINDDGSHDLGFKFMATYGNALAFSQSIDRDAYKQVILSAAATLAKRYQPEAQLLSSDWDDKYFENSIPVVSDIMMNLELLLWAAENGGNKEWATIARNHALKTYRDFVRDNGSSYHIVRYQKGTGNIINKGTLQGDGDETTWARGHAWMIYGMVVMYRYTHQPIFLEHAKTLSNYLITKLPKDGISMWDLDSKILQPDTSASAIFASALIEMSDYIKDDQEKAKIIKEYKLILSSLMSKPYFIEDTSKAPIIDKSVHYYTKPSAIDVPAIFTDYYFLEALNRYKKGL